MYQRVFLTLTIILSIFGVVAAQKTKTKPTAPVKKVKAPKVITYIEDQDEYAVYKAVLKENLQAKEGQTIVLNKEVTGCASIIDQDTRRQFSEEVLDQLFRDCYAKKWGNFELVGNLFQAEDKIVLVSETDLGKLFSPNCNLGWKRFYQKYPNSSGNTSFSRVGFDAQKHFAVVNFGNQSACLGGTGQIIFLQKENDVWKVKKSQKTWG